MEDIDREQLQLGHTGHAKLGQTTDDTLGAVENGRAAPGGFDGVGKKIDNDLYDEDGKPRRTGQLLFSRAWKSFGVGVRYEDVQCCDDSRLD